MLQLQIRLIKDNRYNKINKREKQSIKIQSESKQNPGEYRIIFSNPKYLKVNMISPSVAMSTSISKTAVAYSLTGNRGS